MQTGKVPERKKHHRDEWLCFSVFCFALDSICSLVLLMSDQYSLTCCATMSSNNTTDVGAPPPCAFISGVSATFGMCSLTSPLTFLLCLCCCVNMNSQFFTNGKNVLKPHLYLFSHWDQTAARSKVNVSFPSSFFQKNLAELWMLVPLCVSLLDELQIFYTELV